MTAEAPRRTSPLAALAPALEAASGPGAALRELPFLAQVVLRADPAALDLALPAEPNTVLEAGDRAVLWLGPDEWLLVGPDGDQAAIERELREALARADAWGAVADVSAQRTALELRGPAARDVLATGCSLDLHPRAFAPGACAQTIVGRAAAILWAVSEEPAYRLLVAPSFAPYLAEWLMDAMAEHRAPPQRPGAIR